MGFLDKMKNLFTEEIEEEQIIKEPVKKEVIKEKRYNDIEVKKPTIEKSEKPIKQDFFREPEPVKEPVKQKEDSFVFFTDDDFKDLEKPKREPIKKPVKKEEKPKIYNGNQPVVEPKKEFKPSPVISPVYGVVKQDYEKDYVKPKKSKPTVYRSSAVTIDDFRHKAYGTIEDEIKDDILGKALLEQTHEEVVEPDINIFEELDKYDSTEEEKTNKSTSNVDEIFGRLDNKKEQILDELDEKKDEILDEIDTKTSTLDLLFNEVEDNIVSAEAKAISKEEVSSNDEIDLSDEDESEELAKELEEQKKKLAKINKLMDENQKVTKNKSSKKKVSKEQAMSELKKVADELLEDEINDNLEESELFDLIDSSYEKEADE